MKKTIFSTLLFILFLLFLATFYLSFFGFETDKFNKIIKSKVEESNNNITLDFEKISILIDIKKFVEIKIKIILVKIFLNLKNICFKQLNR